MIRDLLTSIAEGLGAAAIALGFGSYFGRGAALIIGGVFLIVVGYRQGR